MEQLLSTFGNNIPIEALFVVVMLFIAISRVNLNDQKKVGLIYLFSFLLFFFQVVDVWTVLIGSAVALFLMLEIFSNDENRVTMFGFKHKIVDYLYRLFIEYYCSFFIIAIGMMWLCANIINTLPDNREIFVIVSTVLAFLVLAISIINLVRKKFSTFPITYIMSKIKSGIELHELRVTNELQEKFDLLAAFEDRMYFMRKNSQHTPTIIYTLKKIFSKITMNKLLHPFRELDSLFSRGYGTIEMQLIRTIGVEFGFELCRVRRKFFEVLYSNIILNSYRSLGSKDGEKFLYWRQFIMQKYIDNVPVKFGSLHVYPKENLSSLMRLFGVSMIGKISSEQFFVWCLGLPHYRNVGKHAVEMHNDIINEFSLDKNKILKILSGIKQ